MGGFFRWDFSVGDFPMGRIFRREFFLEGNFTGVTFSVSGGNFPVEIISGEGGGFSACRCERLEVLG